MTTAWRSIARPAAPEADSGAERAEAAGRLLVVVIVFAWLASFVVGFKPALTALTAVGFGSAMLGVSRPQLGLLAAGLLLLEWTLSDTTAVSLKAPSLTR